MLNGHTSESAAVAEVVARYGAGGKLLPDLYK